MMSDPSSVDGSTVDELTGKLVLLIDESRPWHEATSMHRELSAKVRHYVRYIRSPSFADEYGQRPQDTIVRLVSLQPPPENTLEFFQRISYELHKNGIDFEYQVGEEGIPVLLGPGTPLAPPPVTAVPPAPPPPPSEPAVADDMPAEVAWEVQEVVRDPETEASGIEAELAAEIEEALDTLEAGTVEHAAAPEVVEAPATLDPEALEPPDVAEISEPPESAAPASISPADELRDAEDQLDAELSGDEDWEAAYLDEGPSELELLIEAPDDVASRFIGVDEPPESTVEAPSDESLEPLPESEQTHPPFFPEEEFGRALPPRDDVETLLRSVDSAPLEPAIIETSSGKRIRLDVPEAAKAKSAADDSRPSLGRAVGAAVGAALVGAVAWAALSAAAGQGASPLAVAVALMVGMSVRLRGGGHTDAFRLVGCLGTTLGSALGALLATAALTGRSEGQGLQGVVNLFINPASLWAAVDTHFDPIDLVSLVIALYIAFKISATRPAD